MLLQELYQRLGQLVAEIPDLAADGPITPEMHRWLGRAAALVELTGDGANAAQFRVTAQNLNPGDGYLRVSDAHQLTAIVYQALARVELKVPLAVQDSFIPVGKPHDALVAVGKVLGIAKADVLIVDPYADDKVLTDFAVLAAERVQIKVLAADGPKLPKPSLRPAASSWIKQHQQTRPLEVRLAPKKVLHDRIIILDNKIVYVLGQSFNALGERSPTALLKAPPDVAESKIDAYKDMWATAKPI